MKAVKLYNIIYNEDFCGEFTVERASEIINGLPKEIILTTDYDYTCIDDLICDCYGGPNIGKYDFEIID